MKKSISLNNLFLTIYLIFMLLYVYASAIGISARFVVIVTFFTMIFFVIQARYLSIELGEKLWLFASVVMFVWTRRIASDVVYYNIIFLLTIMCLIVLQSCRIDIKLEKVLRIYIGMSTATVFLVIAEMILKTKISGVLGVFLPSAALSDELLYINAGTGLRGLASSTNAVSLAAFILLAYLLYRYENNKLLCRLVGIALAIIALVVCGERSNFIFAPLVLVVVYLVQADNKKGLKYFKALVIILCILGLLVILKPQLEQIPALKRTFRTLELLQKGDEIAGERSILYKRAIEMWREKPLLGHGWFEFYYSNTGILKAGSNSHAHNLLYESLAELGVIGTVLLFIPIIYAIVKNVMLIRYSKSLIDGGRHRSILSFVLAVQLFFVLDSMLHLTFFSPRIILYLISLFILFYEKRKLKKIYEI